MVTMQELETVEFQILQLEDDIKAAGISGELDVIIAKVEQLTKARETNAEMLLDMNGVKIAEAEKSLLQAFTAIVGSSEWPELTKQDITQIAFYMDKEASANSPNGPVYALAINVSAKKRVAKSGGGTRALSRSASLKYRMVDGVAEIKTVKDVCITYAIEEQRNLALFGHKAWGLLFPKINTADVLGVVFTDYDEAVHGPVPAVSDIDPAIDVDSLAVEAETQVTE